MFRKLHEDLVTKLGFGDDNKTEQVIMEMLR